MSRLAFVFPGQGSQSVGMLANLADEHPAIHSVFSEASEAAGIDLWELAQKGPESELGQTENTQPVLLTAGVAIFRAWQEAGGKRPDFLAGHSLGEYTALVAAGVITLADGVELVTERGRSCSRRYLRERGPWPPYWGWKTTSFAAAVTRPPWLEWWRP